MPRSPWTLATAVTCGRLAFLPVLWRWAATGQLRWLGIGVMAAFLSDVLDGQLARRLNQVTALGAKLDSAADALLEVSVLAWLLRFRPEMLQWPYVLLVAAAVASWLALVAVGLLRFGRFLNLHLYSSKAGGALGALFAMVALASGFHPVLFYLALGTLTLSHLEGLALMLTRDEVDEHIGSLLRRASAVSRA